MLCYSWLAYDQFKTCSKNFLLETLTSLVLLCKSFAACMSKTVIYRHLLISYPTVFASYGFPVSSFLATAYCTILVQNSSKTTKKILYF